MASEAMRAIPARIGESSAKTPSGPVTVERRRATTEKQQASFQAFDEGAFHAFQAILMVPEAREALEERPAFCASRG